MSPFDLLKKPKPKRSLTPPRAPKRKRYFPPEPILPPGIARQLAEIERASEKKQRQRRRLWLYLPLLLLLLLFFMVYVFFKMWAERPVDIFPNPPRPAVGVGSGGGRVAPLTGAPVERRRIPRSGPGETPLANYADYLPSLTQPQIDHLNDTLQFLFENIHPKTYMGYSFPGDRRLRHWSVIYDDSMRSIMHVKTGDIEMAKNTMNYFIDNKAIRKVGWVWVDGRLVPRPGWIVNIIDAAEGRYGGRGIEHVAHTGPNAYLGIAAAHIYHATGEKKYLNFARSRWKLLKELQNETKGDPNYGGIRMGPMGDVSNPLEQRVEFKEDNPSWYQLYNGEHAADFVGLCELMAQVDPLYVGRYLEAANLVFHWDQKIYDKDKHLFYIGTTEVPFYESNIGQWVPKGIIPQYPLDTAALKISAYGVDGLERFEPNAAVKIRQAIDDNYKNTVYKELPNGEKLPITGYDFITHEGRAKLILYIEEGPNGDIKVNKGRGRKPLVSDEWSNWVALADLRLAGDFLDRGDVETAKKYINNYLWNALGEGFKGADRQETGSLAYPYMQALPDALNKPVGFGWNTHHDPYALIGGTARILGALRFDPFLLNGGKFGTNVRLNKFSVANNVPLRGVSALVTEAEIYLEDAWKFVDLARDSKDGGLYYWDKAAKTAERMLGDHPDWGEVALEQNRLARNSDEPYPLSGLDGVKIKDLTPVFRKYWALYHVGTAEFIRFMAYSELAELAQFNGDQAELSEYKEQILDAANNIVKKYPFAQAFDQRGWLWQPLNSMYEYLGFYQFSPNEYIRMIRSNPEHIYSARMMDSVVESVNSLQ